MPGTSGDDCTGRAAQRKDDPAEFPEDPEGAERSLADGENSSKFEEHPPLISTQERAKDHGGYLI